MFFIICAIANAEELVIRNIRVNGLRRISLGTVLSYLSDIQVQEGGKIDTAETPEIIRTLYKTNFFSDVTLKVEQSDLIINVVERAVIGSLNITGNKKITKKQLMEVLKSVGFTEGQALDESLSYAIKQAIVQQYYNLGLYYAKVNIVTKPESRNRVAVSINIIEGPEAKIKSIKIIGNKAFRERTLLNEFSLTPTRPWSFLTGANQYSKEKLDADLEKLHSYYMDRGYLQMKVDTTRVAITPDKKHLYITIYINEGAVYKLSGFSLEGNLLGKRAEMQKLITLKAGTVFSLKDVTNSQAKINQFLGEYGYGVPDIKEEREINEINKTVWVKFIINPGYRLYVRHIDFRGNYKTRDEVLRREMRLQEGGMFSISQINESRRQLLNLGYLQDIEYKVTPVPESNNQVDLLYNVKETSATEFALTGGYSDKEGLLYSANIRDLNFLGTGKSVGVGFTNTMLSQYYGFNYHDPYFTTNHIGFSFNGYFQRTTPGRVDLSSYRSSTYGAMTSFDIPFSDYSGLTIGVGAEHSAINVANSNTRQDDVGEFIRRYGSSFNQFKLYTSLSYNNLDQAIFPTKGFAHSISVEGYGPLNRSSLTFYKADYSAFWYQPLIQDFIFRAKAEVGYGDGIGKTKSLPFYKNYYAGGIDSVRGFEAGTVGGKTDIYDKSLGGKMLTVASASLILPSPIKDTIRPSIFVDVGSAYAGGFRPKDLRASCGIQVEWRTPLIPITFSLAKPIRKKPKDQLAMFQFSISGSI